MVIRPVDETGDILPVLRVSDLLKGSRATAELIHDRLRLLTGEWWENPGRGNAVLEMLKASRLTEADGQLITGYLSSYIWETPGVHDIRESKVSADGRRLCFSFVAETADGNVDISYETE